jgi:hypothetical protein
LSYDIRKNVGAACTGEVEESDKGSSQGDEPMSSYKKKIITKFEREEAKRKNLVKVAEVAALASEQVDEGREHGRECGHSCGCSHSQRT